MKRYFVSCDYEEDGSFLKIEVQHDREVVETFIGSDPLLVWYEYNKWLYSECDADLLSRSSTMDHWLMDVDGYSEEYFDPETLEFIQWRELEMWDVEKKYPSCIVKNGMVDFKELRDYVKSKEVT